MESSTDIGTEVDLRFTRVVYRHGRGEANIATAPGIGSDTIALSMVVISVATNAGHN